MVYMPDPFPPGTFTANVTVWSTKKNDRGQFNIYVGTTLLVSILPTIRGMQTSLWSSLTNPDATPGHRQSIH